MARSCRDWHRLLEMCALFDTLIGDADGIYDPGPSNDRLLLGLEGTMHGQWKQRLERAAYETALARRRYESVDPDNRLVARTLERDREAALATEQGHTEAHREAVSREPERLSEAEKAAVQRLAEDSRPSGMPLRRRPRIARPSPGSCWSV